MTELDRVLESLLHDLRSPLGVAGGYLRLLREQRLSSADETERAIVKTQDALRTMTTLCAEAAEWLKAEPSAAPAAVPVETMASQIVAEADRMQVAVEVDGERRGTMTLALESERVARAVASLLAVVARGASVRCALRVERGRLSIAAAAAQPRQDPPGAFDPWSYPGLSAALACRTIALAGGRCVRGPEATDVVRVEFDLEEAANAAGTASAG